MATNGWQKASTVGQWVLIVAAIIGTYIALDHRVTVVETGLQQEMRGYQAVFNAIKEQMNAVETRTNRRLDKIDANVTTISNRIDRIVDNQ